MKIIVTLLTASLLLPHAWGQSTIVCEDDFSGPKGKRLNERLVQQGANASTGFFGHSQLILNGNGKVVSSNGGGAANVPLPELKPNDVITLSATVRPAGNPVTWIGIGLVQDVHTLSSFGELTLALRADGAARLFAGAQSAGMTYYKENGAVVVSEGGITEPAELTLTIDSANNHVTAKVNDMVIFDAPVPDINAANFLYAAFEMASQNVAGSDDPGYVDQFAIKIVSPR